MLRSIQGQHVAYRTTRLHWALGSLPALLSSRSLLGGSRGTISSTPLSAGRWSRWAGPKPAQAVGATTTSRTRPPSHRSAPNGRTALGPSASPHVAPPRAARPLADAGLSPRLAPSPWRPDLAAARSGVGGERPGVTPDARVPNGAGRLRWAAGRGRAGGGAARRSPALLGPGAGPACRALVSHRGAAGVASSPARLSAGAPRPPVPACRQPEVRRGPRRNPERPGPGRGSRQGAASQPPPARGGAPAHADPGPGSRVLSSAPRPPAPLALVPLGGHWGPGVCGPRPRNLGGVPPRALREEPVCLPRACCLLAGLILCVRPGSPRGRGPRGRRVLRVGSGCMESLVPLLRREVWGAEARAAVALTVPLYRGESPGQAGCPSASSCSQDLRASMGDVSSKSVLTSSKLYPLAFALLIEGSCWR